MLWRPKRSCLAHEVRNVYLGWVTAITFKVPPWFSTFRQAAYLQTHNSHLLNPFLCIVSGLDPALPFRHRLQTAKESTNLARNWNYCSPKETETLGLMSSGRWCWVVKHDRRWKHYDLSKRRELLSHPHSITSQQAWIFSRAAVRVVSVGRKLRHSCVCYKDVLLNIELQNAVELGYNVMKGTEYFVSL
jgi:hypothetical protein